jgi:hypothetical protein
MSAIPLDISIVPDLSVIKWFGRNQDPTTFTITNNDTRAITDCKLYVTRGDFLPKGAGRAEEAIFMKRAIGEDLVSQGWLEGKVDDGAWANITEISPLLIGALEPEESREFHIRLVVPDTVTNEGKTSFAVMIAAIAAGVALPTLSIALDDADKDEGNSGNTSFTFIVTRAGSLTGESSATWTVSGMGTNPANADDFGGTFPTGTVAFAAGEATQTITIDVSGDTDVEEDETFVVTLSDAVGATISVGGAIGTIRNEDVLIYFTYLIINGSTAIAITGYNNIDGDLNVNIPSIIEGLPVISIEAEAFPDTGLTSLIIPDSVNTIKADAFTNNPIVLVEIGAGVNIDYSSMGLYGVEFYWEYIYTYSRAKGTYSFDTLTWTKI